MGILSLLKRIGGSSNPASEDSSYSCRHPVLVPRWDRVQDMGDESKVSGYRCSTCGASLSSEETDEARQRNAIAL